MRCWRVHIGLPKAGSTTIQRMLDGQREALLEHGWLYPRAASRAGGHHDLAFLLGGGYPDWAKPQDRSLAELGRELAHEVRPHDGPVVISSEDFYLFPEPVALRHLLEEVSGEAVEVHIDLYIRSLPALGLSWYAQAVRAMGYAGSVEENLREMAATWDLQEGVSPWVSTFGADFVHLRAFPPPGGRLAQDYLGVLGCAELWTPALETMENPAFVRDVLEVQRLVNQLPLDKLDKRRFHAHLAGGHAWKQRGLPVHDGPLVAEDALRAWAEPLVGRAVRVVEELGWNGPSDPTEVSAWLSRVPRRKVWRASDPLQRSQSGPSAETAVCVLYALLLELSGSSPSAGEDPPSAAEPESD